MKRTKIFMSLVVVTALTLTACDAPKSCCVPAESVFETTVTVLTDESGATPSVSVTPTATPATVSATSSSTSESDSTEATTTEGSTGSESTSSGSGSEGGSSSEGSGSSSSGSGSSSGSSGSGSSGSGSGSSSGDSGSGSTEPVTTPTATPTQATSTTTYARRACSNCGEHKLVDTPNYRYTTPEQSHIETNPTWDYGIQHCEVQINWMHSSYYSDDEYYNGHYDERPTIRVAFDREVDVDGIPFNNDAEKEATADAISQADAWLKSIGINEPQFSYQTNKGSTDYVNYQENAYTVIDEPEHVYEVGAYVCENCGNVETYGTPTLIS